MRPSRKYMAKGMFHEWRGAVKEIVGRVSSKRTMGVKGTFERMTGKVQRKIGKACGKCGF